MVDPKALDGWRKLSLVHETLPFLVSAIVVCYLYIGLGDGHLFNEDFAVYLQQAWNIAHHVAMTNMGVVQYVDPNLSLLFQSPLTYPPLLPLLYTVPVALIGFDIEVFKVLQLGILLGGFCLFCYAMRTWKFSPLENSISILMFGLSYEIRRSVNSIGSDIPFVLFLIFSLVVVDVFVRATSERRYVWGIVAGVAIFLTINVRTVGVALLPTLLLADCIVSRRLKLLSLIVPIAVTGALWTGQRLLGWSGGTYGFVLHYRFFTPIENIQQFYWALTAPLKNSTFPKIATAIFLLLGVTAAIGLVYETAKGTIIAVFIAVYSILLLILPDFDSGARYLVPQLLVLGAFAVRGAAVINRSITGARRGGEAPVWVTAILGLIWCALVPSPLPPGHWNFGVTSDPARELFAFIREQAPSDALIATSKPRSFHLFTQRTTIRLPELHSRHELDEWLRSHRVTEVAVKYSPARWSYDLTDCPELPLCGAESSPRIKQIFRNSDFVLLQILPGEDRDRGISQ